MSALDLARYAFQHEGLVKMHGDGCPGDLPVSCYEARRTLKAIPANIVELSAEKDVEIAQLKEQVEQIRVIMLEEERKRIQGVAAALKGKE